MLKKRKLQRKRNHRKSMIKNLATSIILYEKIKTTQAKAKAVKPYVEKLITRGKKDNLLVRKYLQKFLPKNAVLKILKVLGPRFKERKGGYLKIIKINPRFGDAAKMAYIEFVERTVNTEAQKKTTEAQKKSVSVMAREIYEKTK